MHKQSSRATGDT